MKYIATILWLCLSIQGYSAETTPIVNLKTNVGTIVIELNAEKAPETVANFLDYVNEGFYDGTIFHRVISSFMIQGGGFTQDFKQKKTRDPVKNEADNGLKNMRGTIAMARTSDPHSATAQFFINVVNNSFLDHTATTPSGWGYAVFGKVIKGMDVVDKIRKIETGRGGSFWRDFPQKLILIEEVSVVKEQPPESTPAIPETMENQVSIEADSDEPTENKASVSEKN
jgi:cyclophilin family peptidyl-prolyl cis-trans isomerase